MSDPKVIYLGPECEGESCDGRTWADHIAWPDCDCKHKPVRYVIAEDYDAALAREAQLIKDKSDDENTFNREIEKREKREDALREELAALKVAAANVIVEGDALQQRLTAAEKLLQRSQSFVAFVHKCVRKNKEYAPLHWQEMVELDRDLSALKPAEGEGL